MASLAELVVFPMMVKASFTCSEATVSVSSSLSLRMSESTSKESRAVPAVGACKSKATSALAPGASCVVFRDAPVTETGPPAVREMVTACALASRLVRTTPAVAESPTRSRRGSAVRTLMGFCTSISLSPNPEKLPLGGDGGGPETCEQVRQLEGNRDRAVPAGHAAPCGRPPWD